MHPFSCAIVKRKQVCSSPQARNYSEVSHSQRINTWNNILGSRSCVTKLNMHFSSLPRFPIYQKTWNFRFLYFLSRYIPYPFHLLFLLNSPCLPPPRETLICFIKKFSFHFKSDLRQQNSKWILSAVFRLWTITTNKILKQFIDSYSPQIFSLTRQACISLKQYSHGLLMSHNTHYCLVTTNSELKWSLWKIFPLNLVQPISYNLNCL